MAGRCKGKGFIEEGLRADLTTPRYLRTYLDKYKPSNPT